MNPRPPFPLDRVNLVGDATIRGVGLELPREIVSDFLPYGLELGKQRLTAPGNHPLILLFQENFRAHMTVPTLLPNMSYHEMIVEVPFCYVARDVMTGGRSGPFCYMVRLWLDNLWATMGGVMFWGFTKRLAKIDSVPGRYAVADRGGRQLLSLDYQTHGAFQPLANYPLFEPMRQIQSQPLVSQLPLGEGPVFVCSNFDKQWDQATLRPLSGAVRIDQSFVLGLPLGTFPAEGHGATVEESPLGAFELKARWRLSLLYPTFFSSVAPAG